MSFTDVVALIGAGAWLPYLVKLVADRVTRPEVRIVTQGTAEVGYTIFGPIFNIAIAFTVRRRDAVISGIKMRLRHQSGEERLFSVRGASQRLGQIQAPDQPQVFLHKELSVLAIKLTTKDVEERFFRFQEDDFLEKKEEHELRAAKKFSHMSQPGPCDIDEFLRSDEMKELYSFVKHGFNWKPGKYTVTFEVESPEALVLRDNQREFVLTQLSVESLETNKSFTEDAYEDTYKINTEAYQSHKSKWNWVNPVVNKGGSHGNNRRQSPSSV